MGKIELAIDLGSNYITVYQMGIGLVLKEPTIAIAKKVKSKYEILDAGFSAQESLVNVIEDAKVFYPIKQGKIVDEKICALMVDFFLDKLVKKNAFGRNITVIALISPSMELSDRNLTKRVIKFCGAKEIYLVESPIALYSYTGNIGGIFVDIGGGKTEIATILEKGIMSAVTVNIGGNAINKAIIDMVANYHGVKIGEFTTEKLKLDALSIHENNVATSFVVGKSLEDGTAKNISVKCSDLFETVLPMAQNLVEVIKTVLKTTPPNLADEIMQKGIFISGASSKIPGLKEFIAEMLDLTVTPLDNVESAVAIGGGYFFADKKALNELLGIKIIA